MFQTGLKNKDIDLLKVYKQKKEPSPYASIGKYLAIPVGAAILLLSLFGIVTYQNHVLESDIAAAKDELQSVQKQVANDPNLKLYQALQETLREVNLYSTLHKDLQSYPQLSQNTFDQILIASDVRTSVVSLSYQKETQVIALQVESFSAEDTEQFVRRLKKSRIFEAVDYSGYAQSQKEAVTTNTEEAKENKDQKQEEKDANTAAQQLLDMLAQLNQTTPQTNTQTSTVYTATVLCKIK